MKVFTVLGPSGSGKSTLVAALARLDGHSGETLGLGEAAALTRFGYLGEDWTAIELAGSAEGLAMAGPALAMSDTAVLVVPADSEAAVLAAPWLRLVEDAGMPCQIFVNRMDATTERVRDIAAALQAYSRHHIVLRQIPIRKDGVVTGAVDLISERAWHYREGRPSALVELPADLTQREREARAELLESLADFDDHLLEELIEDQAPMTEEVFEVARKTLGHCDLIPAFLGAASHANGITRLMKSLRHEAPDHQTTTARLTADPAVIAIGGLADMRKHLGKLVVVRALGEGVTAGASLAGTAVGGLTQIDVRTPAKTLAPGEIGLTVKSDHLVPGRLYTATGTLPLPAWAGPRPGMCREIVSASHDRDDVRLSAALARLVEIDPGLALAQDEASGKAILTTQSPMHSRRVLDRLAADFGIEAAAAPVSPAFRETVARKVENHHRHRKQSGGAGQFADVVIELMPQPRGAGFTFAEEVKGGAVPRNYIPAVEAGAQDALAAGPNGFPVVDIRVVLKDGKSHAVDSSDYAFRTAGRNAVKEALASAGPFVLQPILRAEIHVPSAFTGALVPMISGLKGQVLGFTAHPESTGWDVFTALLPAAALNDLYRTLGSATRGTAWFETTFESYEEATERDIRQAAEAVG